MAERAARRLVLGAVLALVSAACTVSPTTTPPIAGPSGFALNFALTATPDSISQNGSSQSAIVVTARDANGKSVSGLVFRLDVYVGSTVIGLLPEDYGTLSGKTLVTGSDGRATAVYTSPPAPPSGSTQAFCPPLATGLPLPGTCVTILATPISTGYGNGTNTQTVLIHLLPVGIILPPADTPTASFVITPTPVSTNVATNFDGSASCAGSATGSGSNLVCNPSNNTIVSYLWGFGDGGAAMGRTASHSYSTPGAYTVTLTVINDGGRTASTTQTVSVAASVNPTASFVFSPGPPITIGQVIQFNASASAAAVGRSLVSFVWNWGDGTPNGGGQTTSHSYAAAGAYAVSLTVTDDAGQSSTVVQTVAVGVGNPQPVITPTPAGGLHPVTINFSSVGSLVFGGATVTSYLWDFGDPSSLNNTSAAANPSHLYSNTGTFTVRLTITDSIGRVGTTTITVIVT